MAVRQDTEIHPEIVERHAVADRRQGLHRPGREGIFALLEQRLFLGEQVRPVGHEARPVAGMDVPCIGHQHVAENDPLADEECAIFAVEPVLAAEVDELDDDMLAGLGDRCAQLIHVVEQPDDDAGMGAGEPDDQRETHAGPLDRSGNQIRPGIADPHNLWRDQAWRPLKQLCHLVASRADDRFGTVEHLPGISSQELLQILQGLRILVRICDQVEDNSVGM